MNKQELPTMVVVVSLTNGQTNTHVYAMPAAGAQAMKLHDQIVDMIASYIKSGGKRFLVLPAATETPNSIYSPQSVVSITVDYIAAKEFEEIINNARESASRKLGFLGS